MKKAKVSRQARTWLAAQFQQALIDGNEWASSRPTARPFLATRNRVGGLSIKFDLRAAGDELLAFFTVALFARNEKLGGRKFEDYTDAEASSLLSTHEDERRKFIPLALSLLDEQVQVKLEEALSELLSEVKWQALHKLGFPLNPDDLDNLLRRSSRVVKKRVEAPGAGRPRGSTSARSKQERLREQAAFEESVIDAVMRLYPPDNHSKPLKKIVAGELGISVRTLTRRTESKVGKTFEELVEIAEMRQRN